MRVLILAGCTLLALPVWAAGFSKEVSVDETPLLARQQEKTPAYFYTCQQDSDCVLVQGVCGALALNGQHRDAYNALNASSAVPQAKCPQVKYKGLPHAVCTEQQCTVFYSPKTKLSPSDKR